MATKFTVKITIGDDIMYLSKGGWDENPKNRTLFDTEDIAHDVYIALKEVDNNPSHIYTCEEVKSFRHFVGDTAYSLGVHPIHYMKPEVARKFANNYRKYIERCDTSELIALIESQGIIDSFSWHSTPEGIAYWDGVSKEWSEFQQI